ncbi:MAG: HD domain-containing protein [Lachnospiraceae bacterium]|jgi:HD-GYP domain-containing protein (c-di-GMP phosphodiesterase class II)|nr:HD domain-containing protein [Lachnospiraceae bacterium]
MNFSKYLMDDFQRDVNKTMATVCRIGALLMILVIILNATGVFALDSHAYPPLVGCVIVMFIPTLYYDFLHMDSPGMRYVFLTMTVVMCGILYTYFSYHVVIMLIFPTVMACLYCDKRDVIYTEAISVPVIIIAHLSAYYVRYLSDEPLQTMHRVVYYGIIPRLIEFLSIAVLCYGITERIQKLIRDLVRKNNELVANEQMLIESLTKVIELQSQETGGHVRRVSEYTRILCTAWGMSPEMVWMVSTAAMMHDVGKLYVPVEVQEKPARLTDDEYEIMKRHVYYGEKMFENSTGELMEIAKAIALQHHERYDGKGYLGIKGEEIDFNARCVAIADVFDALVSSRPYKKPWTPEEAKRQIISQKGRQFDPELVDIFVAHFDEFLAVFKKYPDAQEEMVITANHWRRRREK